MVVEAARPRGVAIDPAVRTVKPGVGDIFKLSSVITEGAPESQK